ncbi:helix-turn-helix transcriptional regulator [Dyella agri]|uniref:AlpA family phage regulatory protein n=1 Tax=Dyella agri TaxID=1926869 RepID=A0ABW8KF56_9GAMM
MLTDTIPVAPADQPHVQWVIQALHRILAALYPNGAATTDGRRRAVRAKEAQQILGLKRSDFYARQNVKSPSWDPTFPKSFKLGRSANSPTVWYVDELEIWLERHASSRVH